MAEVVVVGGGIGGLATAMRLQAAGRRVTLVEGRSQLGGRAAQLREGGYTFDTGPTIVTAPHLLASVWSATGRELRQDVELVPLRPFYEVRFRDGSRFSYGGRAPGCNAPNQLGCLVARTPGQANREVPADLTAAMEAEIARFNPGDVAGYRRFMVDTERLYQRAFEQLGRQPFHSLAAFARVVPELARLGAQRSVYQFVASYFRDERLRIVFSFHPLFIGGSPFRASTIFSIIPYLEHTGGVWFVRGGTYQLVEAMARRFAELGGDVRCGDAVAEILVRDGRAAGVRLVSGAMLSAEIVVSNADAATTLMKLVPPRIRRRVLTRRLDQMSYSMSCFLLYLGLDRQYPELQHHTVLMPRRYRAAVEAISHGQFLEDDLAVYVHAPTRTDPSLAPPGGESLYALVPVPNLAGQLDWPTAGDRLRDKVLRLLQDELGLVDLEWHIVVERRFTPLDFRDTLASHLGAAFSIEPTLLQSAYFRPHNRSSELPGLYLVGAGTHPGAGLPGVLLSAEIVADLIGERGGTNGSG